MTSVLDSAGPLAEVVRGDLVESVHLGHLVTLDASGRPTWSWVTRRP